MKKNILFAGLLAIFLCLSAQAARAESFEKPRADHIIKTLIRFGTLDINSNEVIDLYASIVACDLYQEYYHNDFKWEALRKALRSDIAKTASLFPTGYRYDAVMQLGRFDFRDNVYRFTAKSTQFAASVFTMKIHQSDLCGKTDGLVFPTAFQLVLDEPLEMLGIPMLPEDGNKLLERMEKNDNPDHVVYVRFNIQVVYIEPFMKSNVRTRAEEKQELKRDSKTESLAPKGTIRLDSRLASIEYFEDPERTKMLYKYQP